TIGPIITCIRDELMIQCGLVDELVVIDSDSTDETASVAEGAGAHVFSAATIRPDLGWRPGKGEAMWKSLLATTGDLIVFIDADLTNFDSRYVTGLLGPLLLHDDISLVKGLYDRDLAVLAQGASQGGRVTELTARPLISLWWPELAGVIQPLAGEWAARRVLLEALEFPSGYGVEFAVLIDTFTRLGLDAIAQVDLGIRSHVHQDLASLGAMAAEVAAAAARRRFGDAPRSDAEISHVKRSHEGEVHWTSRPINLNERPALASLHAMVPSTKPAEEIP
ncbi:MAG: glucosyl-3-phosphoglycerate synthase, partial [Actinobacteria bacterium]|nr:glucosyl-3-phosphoglycerate synthase [Actinomycetota bacterium]